jgi:hypothetical protein
MAGKAKKITLNIHSVGRPRWLWVSREESKKGNLVDFHGKSYPLNDALLPHCIASVFELEFTYTLGPVIYIF